MQRDFVDRHTRENRFEHVRHLRRMRDADRIADGDLEYADLDQTFGNFGDPSRGDAAFVGTSERR